jgi:hypothetical protein
MRNFRNVFAWLILLFGLFATDLLEAQGVRVRGYTRKNGTYVAPHYRSSPDGNFNNNWSTKGNINPHTGQPGEKVTPPGSTTYQSIPYSSGAGVEEAARMAERKAYWTSKGWDVSKINASSSFALDQKIQEAARTPQLRLPAK